jgi:hypothetical protein
MFEETDKHMLALKDTHYICHLCNCFSKRAFGLTRKIFYAYSDANTYKKKGFDRIPGTISMHGKIVNMYAQIYPHKPYYASDTYKHRLNYFWLCLLELHFGTPHDANIAFPKCLYQNRDYFEMIHMFWKLEKSRTITFAAA